MSRTQPGHRGPPILCGNEVVAKPQCVAHLPLELTQMWHNIDTICAGRWPLCDGHPCRTVATGIRFGSNFKSSNISHLHKDALSTAGGMNHQPQVAREFGPSSSNALRGYDLWPLPLPVARASCTVVSNKHFNTSGSSASSRRWHPPPPSSVIRTFGDECSPRTWRYMVLESSWIPMIPDDSWWNPHIPPRELV